MKIVMKPEGYLVPGQKDKVLRLSKSLYGLNQPVRVSNLKTAAILEELRFSSGSAVRKGWNNDLGRRFAGGQSNV